MIRLIARARLTREQLAALLDATATVTGWCVAIAVAGVIGATLLGRVSAPMLAAFVALALLHCAAVVAEVIAQPTSHEPEPDEGYDD